MSREAMKLAREAGLEEMWELTPRFISRLERLVELVRADERERIKQENAPVIASINAHIQTLEEAAHGIKENT